MILLSAQRVGVLIDGDGPQAIELVALDHDLVLEATLFAAFVFAFEALNVFFGDDLAVQLVVDATSAEDDHFEVHRTFMLDHGQFRNSSAPGPLTQLELALAFRIQPALDHRGIAVDVLVLEHHAVGAGGHLLDAVLHRVLLAAQERQDRLRGDGDDGVAVDFSKQL